MKQKIIWFVYVLFFVYVVFVKTFVPADSFTALARKLDFSKPTLIYSLGFVFNLVISLLMLFLRRTRLVVSGGVSSVLTVRTTALPVMIYTTALFCQFFPVSSPVETYTSVLDVFLLGGMLVVFGPIMEEIFFREIMLSHFIVEKKMTRRGAVALGVIMFYSIHVFNENSDLLVIVFGIFASLLFIYTHNIVMVIILHSVQNLIILLARSGAFPVIGRTFALVMILMSLPLMVTAFVLLVRSARKAERTAVSISVS